MEKLVHFWGVTFLEVLIISKNTLIQSRPKLNFLQKPYWVGAYVDLSQ